MRYTVDTHALVWHLTDDARLGPQARRILDDDSAHLIIPSIVLAEAKYIAERKRVAVTFREILDAVLGSPQATVFPFDLFLIEHLPESLEIHDGILVATARFCRELFHEDVSILTNDIAITQSGLVPAIW